MAKSIWVIEYRKLESDGDGIWHLSAEVPSEDQESAAEDAGMLSSKFYEYRAREYREAENV